jgi:hypothetical protein
VELLLEKVYKIDFPEQALATSEGGVPARRTLLMLLQSLLFIAPARFSALGELVSQPSDDPQMGPSRYTYSSSPSTHSPTLDGCLSRGTQGDAAHLHELLSALSQSSP